jgi:hypothetical protein
MKLSLDMKRKGIPEGFIAVVTEDGEVVGMVKNHWDHAVEFAGEVIRCLEETKEYQEDKVDQKTDKQEAMDDDDDFDIFLCQLILGMELHPSAGKKAINYRRWGGGPNA